MHVIGLDRVVLATHDIDETAGQFADALGLEFSETLHPVTETDAGSQAMDMVVSAAGIEIVTPDDPDGEIARFLDENGPGLYALSLRVADLDAAEAALAEQGLDPVGEFESPDFRERFYHPAAFGGAFVILAEYDAPHPVASALTSG